MIHKSFSYSQASGKSMNSQVFVLKHWIVFFLLIIRVISGFGGALYVWVHRRYVFYMRSNKILNKFLQKNRFLYPGILALMVRFPPSLLNHLK